MLSKKYYKSNNAKYIINIKIKCLSFKVLL